MTGRQKKHRSRECLGKLAHVCRLSSEFARTQRCWVQYLQRDCSREQISQHTKLLINRLNVVVHRVLMSVKLDLIQDSRGGLFQVGPIHLPARGKQQWNFRSPWPPSSSSNNLCNVATHVMVLSCPICGLHKNLIKKLHGCTKYLLVPFLNYWSILPVPLNSAHRSFLVVPLRALLRSYIGQLDTTCMPVTIPGFSAIWQCALSCFFLCNHIFH
jgi:hypothetical protein